MLKHIVLMKFKPGTTEDQIRDLEKGLGGLPAVIPEIKEFTFGRDLRPERAYDFALVSSFDDFAALGRYRPHPEHMIVLNKVKAMCSEIKAVDFEY
ncbi:MAG: Dabb family protein [Syntrophales bacterium]|nr:Dabb family protein [Syntrophales bacterium]MDD5532427.1 Dabb family protein [Syntrophales bacterium]